MMFLRYFVYAQEPWLHGYRPWTTIIETVVLEEALRIARERLLEGYNVRINQKEDKGEVG